MIRVVKNPVRGRGARSGQIISSSIGPSCPKTPKIMSRLNVKFVLSMSITNDTPLCRACSKCAARWNSVTGVSLGVVLPSSRGETAVHRSLSSQYLYIKRYQYHTKAYLYFVPHFCRDTRTSRGVTSPDSPFPSPPLTVRVPSRRPPGWGSTPPPTRPRP